MGCFLRFFRVCNFVDISISCFAPVATPLVRLSANISYIRATRPVLAKKLEEIAHYGRDVNSN